MLAYTKENGPKIWPSVDYINVSIYPHTLFLAMKPCKLSLTQAQVMSYDLMNRRDTVTKHHSSVTGSEDTIKNYLAIGAPPEKMNRK
jgi:chitinase